MTRTDDFIRKRSMQQQQQRLLSVAVFTILLLYIDCVVKGSH